MTHDISSYCSKNETSLERCFMSCTPLLVSRITHLFIRQCVSYFDVTHLLFLNFCILKSGHCKNWSLGDCQKWYEGICGVIHFVLSIKFIFLQRMVIFTRLWYIYLDYIVCLNNKYMTETVMFGIKYVEP